MRIKTVVWNMNHKSWGGNWDVLVEHPDLAGADIALLCEATDVPERPEANGLRAIGNGSTRGLDCRCTGALDRCTKRRYATAVVSPRPITPMPEDTRTRWGVSLQFRPSRPGTWTAARVDLGEIRVTAIAIYGLNDENYDSSVHRSLSELSPVFDHPNYGKYLVLGGDLNILAGKRSRRRPYRGQLVLERIKAYGLIDCLEKALPPDRYEDPAGRAEMDNCQCGLGEACTHTRTYYDKSRPQIPYQDDYLFASPELAGAGRLVSCTALPVGPGSPSDHAPIVATFEV
jgi:Endonuclease/Exonuclease/phosphatase family